MSTGWRAAGACNRDQSKQCSVIAGANQLSTDPRFHHSPPPITLWVLRIERVMLGSKWLKADQSISSNIDALGFELLDGLERQWVTHARVA